MPDFHYFGCAEGTHARKNPNKFGFLLLSLHRTLATPKVGCTSEIKIKTIIFCISLDLDKILSLKREKTFSLCSLIRIFALPLQR